jgi:hypothetical protein
VTTDGDGWVGGGEDASERAEVSGIVSDDVRTRETSRQTLHVGPIHETE